jgi:hypothetical protein
MIIPVIGKLTLTALQLRARRTQAERNSPLGRKFPGRSPVALAREPLAQQKFKSKNKRLGVLSFRLTPAGAVWYNTCRRDGGNEARMASLKNRPAKENKNGQQEVQSHLQG